MSDDVEAHDESAASPAGRTASHRVWGLVARVAVFVTVLVGLPTVGAFGAELAWPLEIFSHFRVQYAAALAILAVVLMVTRHFGWATVAVVLLALNAWQIAPFVLPTRGVRTSGEGSRLKLVSINVWSGNRTPERVIDFLQEADADVVVVLEFTPEWERRFTALDSTYPHAARHSSAGNFGIALYSRMPLEDFEWVTLSESNQAIAARMRVDGELVTVVGAHPFPPMGPRGSELRNRQLDQLAKYVSTLSGPVIVAGDLNITPFSPYLDEFLAAAKLHDPRRGQGLLTTWPANRLPLRIPIDHCLISDGLTARLSTGPDVGSDHLPVVAEIGVPGKSTARP